MALFRKTNQYGEEYQDSRGIWLRAIVRLVVLLLLIGLIIWAAVSLYNRNTSRVTTESEETVIVEQPVQEEDEDATAEAGTGSGTTSSPESTSTDNAGATSVAGAGTAQAGADTLPATGADGVIILAAGAAVVAYSVSQVLVRRRLQ